MIHVRRAGLAAFFLLSAFALDGCGAYVAMPQDASAASGGDNASANTAYGWAFSGQYQ